MAALSFEKWLSSGAEGAATADAAAAACTSKNVARYTVDVKSACKKVDASDNANADTGAGGGMEYAIQYEVSYSCRAKGGQSKSSSSSSLAAKKTNASAPSPALSAAAAAPAAAPSGPVKVEATLRTLVSQPPLKESADGSLVRPKPLAKETWFVEVRKKREKRRRREGVFFPLFFFFLVPLEREKAPQNFFLLSSLFLSLPRRHQK